MEWPRRACLFVTEIGARSTFSSVSATRPWPRPRKPPKWSEALPPPPKRWRCAAPDRCDRQPDHCWRLTRRSRQRGRRSRQGFAVVDPRSRNSQSDRKGNRGDRRTGHAIQSATGDCVLGDRRHQRHHPGVSGVATTIASAVENRARRRARSREACNRLPRHQRKFRAMSPAPCEAADQSRAPGR